MRSVLTTLLTLLSIVAVAQNDDLESCLKQIDEAIEQSPQTVSRYEQQIEETRLQYRHAHQPG